MAGISARNIVIIPIDQLLSYEALEMVINNTKHISVLDVGCGQGIQGRFMQDYGKQVTGLTISREEGYDGKCLENVIYANFMTENLSHKYDIVWVSHLLEHMPDVEAALRKMKELLSPDGCLALTVPRETSIMLPHIHTFSAGRLLRYLLCAGYDCRNAQILEYGYNISVLLPEARFIQEKFCVEEFVNESMNSSRADEIFTYLPKEIKLSKSWDDIYYFNGNITKVNWGGKTVNMFYKK